MCNLVEQWSELGYEHGCEDGVDEAALFSLFKPVCETSMPWERCSSSSSSSVSRSVSRRERGGVTSHQYHAFQFGLGFGVKGREAEDLRRKRELDGTVMHQPFSKKCR